MARIRYVDSIGTAQVIQIAQSGSAVARELSRMPHKRDICLEVGPRLRSDPCSNRYSYNEASMGYIVGKMLLQKCDRCAHPGGRLAECVVVEKPDGKKYFGGSCTNCRHTDHPEHCSLVQAAGNQGVGNGDDKYQEGNTNDEDSEVEIEENGGDVQRERGESKVAERGNEEGSPAPEQVDNDNSGSYRGALPLTKPRFPINRRRQQGGGKLLKKPHRPRRMEPGTWTRK